MQEEYSLMENTLENAVLVEQMRFRAYGVQSLLEVIDSEYVTDIVDSNILVFICKIDNKLASVCYISDYHDTLFVEYLFTLPEYQKQGLHYGRKLLEYILEHKEIAEKHFNKKFTTSELCTGSNYVIPIYESIGYKQKRLHYGTMTKPL